MIAFFSSSSSFSSANNIVFEMIIDIKIISWTLYHELGHFFHVTCTAIHKRDNDFFCKTHYQ